MFVFRLRMPPLLPVTFLCCAVLVSSCLLVILLRTFFCSK